MLKRTTSCVSALILTFASAGACASGSHGHGHGHGSSKNGEPGKAGDVTRTVEVTMGDNFYKPKSISVSDGETVKFVVKNNGALVHEFNIANKAMHTAHQKEMLEMMQKGVLLPTRLDHEKMHGAGGMAHDDPNSILLEPGKTGEIIWKFADATNLEFACNVPGHYAAGMVGRIHVK